MTTENDIEFDVNGELIDQVEYQRSQAEAYAGWLGAQTQRGRFQVMVHGSCGLDSPVLNSVAECEKWVSENLPVSIQKCRTQSYSIDKVEGEI